MNETDQGAAWTPSLREQFYRLDQGSRLIPLAWLRALEQRDGTPLLSDHLTLYGFLQDGTTRNDLAVGVTLAASTDGQSVGFTCAACHTREIVAGGRRWRIDGAPALLDLQRFLSDLDGSVRRVLEDRVRFRNFADKVVGPRAADQAALFEAVQRWSAPFHAYVSALPPDPWGPGRLDAFGLIFNQLAGLDVAEAPSLFIGSNIVRADAPVRYPFLWNSSFQDRTDWPGFADNGNDRMALARNISEALGVFAVFHPKRAKAGAPLNRDYLAENSEDTAILEQLEADVVALQPPKWPWPIDGRLAEKGKAVFDRHKEDGGCVECHGVRAGVLRGPRPTLATPVLDVGTDTRMWERLGRTVHTGAMAGAAIPGLAPLKETDTAANLLVTSVVGILEQASQKGRAEAAAPLAATAPASGVAPGAAPKKEEAAVTNSYEARALAGIWAAAPYLHDGSVPTLADLLQTATQRPRRFAVGQQYDVTRVGLALDQGSGAFLYRATGCEFIDSGNSNCGHEYGTALPAGDKAALLEYLKSL